MTDLNFIYADCVAWANAYTGEKFHALLADCPYEISFMGRKEWDGTGVSFNPDTWRALARVLHDGAYLFVCAGTLNDDLISVAMRESGLRKCHKAMLWAYGSGLGIGARLDTQIDEAAGEVRDDRIMGGHILGVYDGNARTDKPLSEVSSGTPVTDLARQWAGHRYGKRPLKPACETILIFQKPYTKGVKPVDSITQTGAGAMWIDGGRIGVDKISVHHFEGHHAFDNGRGIMDYEAHTGRWPANLLLSHAPACQRIGVKRVKTTARYGGLQQTDSPTFKGLTDSQHRTVDVSTNGDGSEDVVEWQCVADCPVRVIGQQSGESQATESGYNFDNGVNNNPSHVTHNIKSGVHYGDSGTAARYFFQADWSYEIAERIAAADPVRYQAKASTAERNAGAMDLYWRIDKAADVGFALIARDEWLGLCDEEARVYAETGKRIALQVRGNIHSTVKPIALMRYLATVLLPPDAYAPRRLVVPFCGSGSECFGGLLAGWEHITGIELMREYVTIAEARRAFFQAALQWGHDELEAIINTSDEDGETDENEHRQMEMFA